MVFSDHLRVITLRIQRTKAVDAGADDIFCRLRFVLPAGKQSVIAIQCGLRQTQALFFRTARHISQAYLFGGGVKFKLASLCRRQSNTL